jgi:hypothetical protein
MIGWPIARFLSFPIAFLLPGYRSFCAVMTPGGADDTRYLSYWLICSFLFIFEAVFAPLLPAFPFYYELKCVLLLYLQKAAAKRAWTFYFHYFGPLLKHLEPAVDKFFASYSQQATKIQRKAQSAALGAVVEGALKE